MFLAFIALCAEISCSGLLSYINFNTTQERERWIASQDPRYNGSWAFEQHANDSASNWTLRLSRIRFVWVFMPIHTSSIHINCQGKYDKPCHLFLNWRKRSKWRFYPSIRSQSAKTRCSLRNSFFGINEWTPFTRKLYQFNPLLALVWSAQV